MLERLLENWLDSASELSYQQVFVQMLSASGYTVLHSTRHCLLEFGKDVLAIAPDGVGCAFQLKGQPNKQMTVSEFRRDIQPQLVQLMSQPPAMPGFPPGIHRSYLVSNGSFSEEVQVAVSQMNTAPYPSKLELWSRGKLLDMALSASTKLWPSEIDDTRRLLDLYMADTSDQLPLGLLAGMLSSILLLDQRDSESAPPSVLELSRVSSSAMWATSIALSPFVLSENHQAVAVGWTVCRAMLQATYEKNGGKWEVSHHFELAERAILDALAALWVEVSRRDHLAMPPGLEDSVIYGWRIGVLRGLLSSLYLANESRPLLPPEDHTELGAWLMEERGAPDLWGEAAIACEFPPLLVLCKKGDDTRVADTLASFAATIIALNQADSRLALSSPYYDGTASFLAQMSLDVEESEKETFEGSSYMARVLLLSLAAIGEKSACKRLWRDFSKLSHRYFLHAEEWMYLVPTATQGQELTRIYPSTYEWSSLVSEAEGVGRIPNLPTWLLAMWWQACPHRASAGPWLSSLVSSRTQVAPEIQ